MHTTTPNPQTILGYAQISLLVLRQNGLSDDAIRSGYLAPHKEADREFEAAQVREFGRIVAPAKRVISEMRRLLAH